MMSLEYKSLREAIYLDEIYFTYPHNQTTDIDNYVTNFLGMCPWHRLSMSLHQLSHHNLVLNLQT